MSGDGGHHPFRRPTRRPDRLPAAAARRPTPASDGRENATEPSMVRSEPDELYAAPSDQGTLARKPAQPPIVAALVTDTSVHSACLERRGLGTLPTKRQDPGKTGVSWWRRRESNSRPSRGPNTARTQERPFLLGSRGVVGPPASCRVLPCPGTRGHAGDTWQGPHSPSRLSASIPSRSAPGCRCV